MAVGQAVSALALVFVVIQVRHARNELRRGARQDRLQGTRDTFFTQANPQLASLIQRLWSSTGSRPIPFIEHGVAAGLTEGEARQVYAYVVGGWQTVQGSIESVDLFSPGLREDLDARIRSLYSGLTVCRQSGTSWRSRP